MNYLDYFSLSTVSGKIPYLKNINIFKSEKFNFLKNTEKIFGEW